MQILSAHKPYTPAMNPGIHPFRAYRFADAASLPTVSAPPYDAIEPGQDRALLDVARNITHLTLVPAEEAASTLRRWREDGILVRDGTPALYLEREEFTFAGRTCTREVLHGLVPLDPARGAAPVLFHEETYAPVVAAQQEVLRTTNANLDSTMLLYEDEDGRLDAALDVIRAAPEVVRFRDGTGRQHALHRLDDPAATAALGARFAGVPLLIADGHHRTESAMRHAAGDGRGAPGAALRLMGLVRAQSPGLLLLPTHRVLTGAPGEGLDRVREEAAAAGFPVHPVSRAEAAARMEADRAAVLALPAGGEAGLEISCRGGARGAALFIHRRLLPALGQTRPSLRRDTAAALSLLDDGAHSLALLLAAPRVDDVRVAADAGLPMPPKSTCFHPKLQSGLLLRSLNDFPES